MTLPGSGALAFSAMRAALGRSGGQLMMSEMYGFADDTVASGKISTSMVRGKARRNAASSATPTAAGELVAVAFRNASGAVVRTSTTVATPSGGFVNALLLENAAATSQSVQAYVNDSEQQNPVDATPALGTANAAVITMHSSSGAVLWAAAVSSVNTLGALSAVYAESPTTGASVYAALTYTGSGHTPTLYNGDGTVRTGSGVLFIGRPADASTDTLLLRMDASTGSIVWAARVGRTTANPGALHPSLAAPASNVDGVWLTFTIPYSPGTSLNMMYTHPFTNATRATTYNYTTTFNFRVASDGTLVHRKRLIAAFPSHDLVTPPESLHETVGGAPRQRRSVVVSRAGMSSLIVAYSSSWASNNYQDLANGTTAVRSSLLTTDLPVNPSGTTVFTRLFELTLSGTPFARNHWGLYTDGPAYAGTTFGGADGTSDAQLLVVANTPASATFTMVDVTVALPADATIKGLVVARRHGVGALYGACIRASGSVHLTACRFAADGGAVVAGVFTGSMFPGNSDGTTFAGAGASGYPSLPNAVGSTTADGLVVRYSSTGAVVWVCRLTSPNAVYLASLDLGPNGEVVVSGTWDASNPYLVFVDRHGHHSMVNASAPYSTQASFVVRIPANGATSTGEVQVLPAGFGAAARSVLPSGGAPGSTLAVSGESAFQTADGLTFALRPLAAPILRKDGLATLAGSTLTLAGSHRASMYPVVVRATNAEGRFADAALFVVEQAAP